MAITGITATKDVFDLDSRFGDVGYVFKVDGKTATNIVHYFCDENTESLINDMTPKTVKVSLTNAQIKACRATPVTLISAPGAGYMIVVQNVVAKLNAGSEVLTETADNLAVQYDDSGQDILVIESTGFIDQAADTICTYYPEDVAAMAAATVAVNEAVQIFNNGDGEIAGNASADATLDLWITYVKLYVG